MRNVYEIHSKQHPITRRWRFWVRLVDGGNHEPLSTSEMLNSREAVVTNIRAQTEGIEGAYVRDMDLVDPPQMMALSAFLDRSR